MTIAINVQISAVTHIHVTRLLNFGPLPIPSLKCPYLTKAAVLKEQVRLHRKERLREVEGEMYLVERNKYWKERRKKKDAL